MDGVNEPDENGKILNLLDPDEEKQTFGRKSQNCSNAGDENGILLFYIRKYYYIYTNNSFRLVSLTKLGIYSSGSCSFKLGSIRAFSKPNSSSSRAARLVYAHEYK
ncbi:hypothetical protein Hanom_Chr01g00003611 [Helianthus anomalus]